MLIKDVCEAASELLTSDEVKLNPDNVMQVLYLAKKYLLPALADKCTEYLRENLHASNVFLVLPKECENQGLETEGSVKRRILGERIVKAVRFPVMEQKEFADEQVCIRKEKARARWDYPRCCCDVIVFSVDKNIRLHAVRLFGSENSEYSVTLRVYEYNGFVLGTKIGKFLSHLMQSEGGGHEYHGFDIIFEPPIALERKVQYWFEARIVGSPSWYGQDGNFCVEHAGVTFSFYESEYSRSRTAIKAGQFSVF